MISDKIELNIAFDKVDDICDTFKKGKSYKEVTNTPTN